ncbi:MAG: MBOAT family O-acyltransferase, partial [Planctomycetota bacterium]
MLFHTWTFALFFLVFYPVYLALKGTRLGVSWLFLASYVFYAGWNPLFLPLILFSTSVDYVAVIGMARRQDRRPAASEFFGGRCNPLYLMLLLFTGLVRCLSVLGIADRRSKRPWLALSILNNLALLGFFKYSDFLTRSCNAVLEWLGVPWGLVLPSEFFFEYSGLAAERLTALFAWLGLPFEVPAPDSMLPVGISFFIFQSMSYTIDYYRGNIGREPSFIRYATFVSLFPQLVAGPIERAKNLLPQLRRNPGITRHDVADGLSLFVVGLFKKVALADYFALYVDPVYAAPERFESPALLLATFAFAWQIYFDFSGYTDMARGVGRMMGIRLMLNFNNPYLATGLGDFWRRWHISLSTWFRDYVYIP